MALAALMAGGCSETRKAEQRYETAKRAGDTAEMCRQAGQVAQAYLSDDDDKHFKMWRETEGSDCAMQGLRSRLDP
ncbi:MAG: hypothetical protein JWL86_37 [Rhizobium sp.]|nr:hypothetical protein [Rhizobium sp.]